MIVVYVADENYLGFAEKSADTLLKIHPDAKVILVSPEKLDTSFQNVVIPINRDFRHNKNDRISSAAYLKLYLTELPYDKIIYLDGDTIIQKPINELWDMDCEYINITESHDFGKKQAKALGVEKYAMTSVMVMNLTNLRKIDFTNKCLEVESSGFTPSTGWQHDETCINVAMQGKLHFIDKKWNYCHNREYDEPINEQDAHILHICGRDKSLMINPYEEIRPILEYIKGKSVAIVGNASSIFDKNYGQEIDDHDIIIRFNRGFITKPESQGSKTDIVILATELNIDEKASYKAMYYVNRSKNTRCGDYTIGNTMRARLKSWLGKQPSSGFMAIDICRTAKAKSIDIYGFDKNVPTFYNPDGYITQHDYNIEQNILHELEKHNILTNHFTERKADDRKELRRQTTKI